MEYILHGCLPELVYPYFKQCVSLCPLEKELEGGRDNNVNKKRSIFYKSSDMMLDMLLCLGQNSG